MKQEHTTGDIERQLFVVGNILLVVGIVCWGWFIRYQNQYTWGCSIFRLTGFYCPACGGTRALNALLHGRWLQSAAYHPAVPYSVIMYGCFMLSWYVEIISGHRVHCGMRFRPIYIYIGLGILMLQWVMKNLYVV